MQPQSTIRAPATEIWRPVVGYGRRYSISNAGRVRRDLSGPATHAGRLLRLRLTRRGYLEVSISPTRGGRQKHRAVHMLVAEAFLPPRPDGHGVNHINGIKTDNRPSNLEWATPAGQLAHASRLGLLATGTRNGAYTHPETRARGDQNGARLHRERMPRGERHGSRTHPECILRGEQASLAKLTDADVYAIRASTDAASIVAAHFHITRNNVWMIRTRKTWRHLPEQ